MFQKGDMIIYGNSGVCVVEDVGTMSLSGAKKGKIYYTLSQMYSRGGKVYTPVDNDRVVMRKIYTDKEANDYIAQIPQIEPLDLEDEKKRENQYKDALSTCDFKDLVSVIKALHKRERTQEEKGKKLASLDERYMELAKEQLEGELAVSLDISKEEVDGFIKEHIENAEMVK